MGRSTGPDRQNACHVSYVPAKAGNEDDSWIIAGFSLFVYYILQFAAKKEKKEKKKKSLGFLCKDAQAFLCFRIFDALGMFEPGSLILSEFPIRVGAAVPEAVTNLPLPNPAYAFLCGHTSPSKSPTK